MPSWKTYRELLSVHGSTQRERDLNQARDDFAAEEQDHPASRRAVVNGKEVDLMLHATKDLSTKNFDAVYNADVSLGDVVQIGKVHWLVTEIDVTDGVTLRGTIEQCNRQIRWQNPETLQIVTRWCVMTKPYYSNLTNTKYIDSSSREFKVKLPYDKESVLVNIDKRFLMEEIAGEPKAYICTSVDQVTDVFADLGRGFITWNIEQTPVNKVTDNAELMIADYIASPAPNDDTEIQIVGSDRISSGGSAEYVATGAGEILWYVDAPRVCGASTSVADGNLTIQVEQTVRAVGSKIVIRATDAADETRFQEKMVKVVGLL